MLARSAKCLSSSRRFARSLHSLIDADVPSGIINAPAHPGSFLSRIQSLWKVPSLSVRW